MCNACRLAAGTLISRERDMSSALMTSIVLKSHVTLMDIVSTRMLGQFGFLAKIFNIFKDQQISVDVVATSEIAVSLTLDPRWGSARQLFPTCTIPTRSRLEMLALKSAAWLNERQRCLCCPGHCLKQSCGRKDSVMPGTVRKSPVLP